MAEWGGDDAPPPGAEEVTERKTAQELGWNEPTAIDYEAAASKQPLKPIIYTDTKYEYDGEMGDIGPKNPELEAALFDTEFRVVEGEQIHQLRQYKVDMMGPVQVKEVRSFKGVGLHPVMEQIIDLVGYKKPTPIQAYCIPAVTHALDLIAIAQTGSGKTAAYLIPIISRLLGKVKKWAAPRPNPVNYDPDRDAVTAEPLLLVICPTRELAMQTYDEARRFSYRSMLRPCLVYGGPPKRGQLDDLKRGCDILIATPGRLRDFVETCPRWLSLRRLKYTVLDEADEMIQPDWEEEMKSILGGAASNLNDDHHFMMFSATFSKECRAMAKKYMEDDSLRIKVGRAGSVHANVIQDVMWVEQDMKQKCLIDLISSMPPCRTIIFCNSNGKCDEVDAFLYEARFPVTSINSARTQYEREDSMRSFRTGKCPLMVSSSVSARGLDVKNIMHVINYDMPSVEHGGIEEYVHRIGRTARIGNQGQATSFFNDRNDDIGPDLVNVLLETNQKVPDFLDHFKHESGAAFFDDDKSDEGDDDAGGANLRDGADASGGGWGGEATAATNDAPASGGWGEETKAAASGSWGEVAGDNNGW